METGTAFNNRSFATSNLRLILARCLATIVICAAGYWMTIAILGPSTTYLPPISTPPTFSVDYVLSTTNMSALSIRNNAESDMKTIKAAGFDGIKVSFSMGNDNSLQTQVIDAGAKQNLYPMGILLGNGQKPLTRAFTADEMTAWEKFVRQTVHETQNSIYFWEVWNEPNMTELFRYGTPAEYLDLLQRTSAIIREENPDAKIIVTSDMSDRESQAFTTAFFELNPSPCFDILSVHPYGGNDAWIDQSVFAQKIADQKTAMDQYGIRKPLMISEIGQPSERIGEDKQALLATYAFKTAHDLGLPIVWLEYSDKLKPTIDNRSGWGLIDANGNKKPVFQALANYIQSVKKQN